MLYLHELYGLFINKHVNKAVKRSSSGSRVQFSSVSQSCPTPCDPMNLSTPGFPVLHYFLEFAQTHVH